MITGHLLILNVNRDGRKDKASRQRAISPLKAKQNRPVVKTHDIPGACFLVCKALALSVTPKQPKSSFL
jgi:hypothetical protein